MKKKETQLNEDIYNKMKDTEADLIRALQAIVEDPTKKNDLSDIVFKNHQTWLKIIMPNYSPDLHLGIIKGYEADKRYQSYYDDKAGKGATKILVEIVKDHLKQ